MAGGVRGNSISMSIVQQMSLGVGPALGLGVCEDARRYPGRTLGGEPSTVPCRVGGYAVG